MTTIYPEKTKTAEYIDTLNFLKETNIQLSEITNPNTHILKMQEKVTSRFELILTELCATVLKKEVY